MVDPEDSFQGLEAHIAGNCVGEQIFSGNKGLQIISKILPWFPFKGASQQLTKTKMYPILYT